MAAFMLRGDLICLLIYQAWLSRNCINVNTGQSVSQVDLWAGSEARWNTQAPN